MQTYGRIQQTTANPRQLEADLLVRAAAKLQSVHDDWASGGLSDALTFNRRLWTILATSATSEENPLPLQVKQNIGNLAIFIFNRTVSIESEPEPTKLASLITINREIAAGLRGE